VRREARALLSSVVFFVRVFPMLPSWPIDRLTRAPAIEKLSYATHSGGAESDLYRPPSGGPHPGVVVSLGIVPFGVEHPQVARMAQALARAGFAALIHWSPAMRDRRLDPDDTADLVSAYEALVARPDVDASRSGLLGTCVGGSVALMAAASPRIRDRIAFVSAYAPYSSMWTFVRDIAGATRTIETSAGEEREPWRVDPITWNTYVRSLTECVAPEEARRLRTAFEGLCGRDDAGGVITRAPMRGALDELELSEDGRALFRLLHAEDSEGAEAALRALPPPIRERLDAMSPVNYLPELRAPLIHLMHDRYDAVIPVGESRRLVAGLSDRGGVRYTELGFQHLNPTRLSPLRLARELPRFYLAMYPVFRQAMA
jgi:hypothetical protein